MWPRALRACAAATTASAVTTAAQRRCRSPRRRRTSPSRRRSPSRRAGGGAHAWPGPAWRSGRPRGRRGRRAPGRSSLSSAWVSGPRGPPGRGPVHPAWRGRGPGLPWAWRAVRNRGPEPGRAARGRVAGACKGTAGSRLPTRACRQAWWPSGPPSRGQRPGPLRPGAGTVSCPELGRAGCSAPMGTRDGAGGGCRPGSCEGDSFSLCVFPTQRVACSSWGGGVRGTLTVGGTGQACHLGGRASSLPWSLSVQVSPALCAGQLNPELTWLLYLR